MGICCARGFNMGIHGPGCKFYKPEMEEEYRKCMDHIIKSIKWPDEEEFKDLFKSDEEKTPE